MQTVNMSDGQAPALMLNAQQGRLVVVMNKDQPVFITVPFDDVLIKSGVNAALALKLFDEDVLSIGFAAQLAGMSSANFIQLCSENSVSVVRYSPDELQKEVGVLDELRRC